MGTSMLRAVATFAIVLAVTTRPRFPATRHERKGGLTQKLENTADGAFYAERLPM